MSQKAREFTIGGIIMSCCGLAWFVAPGAVTVAAGFVACGAILLGYALYAWRRDNAA